MPGHRTPVAALIVIAVATAAACGSDAGENGAPDDAGGPGAAATEAAGTPPEDVREPDGIPVRAEVVADGLDLPNGLVDLGDGRMLISDQRGAIWLMADGVVRDEPVLDLTDRVLPPDNRGGQELGLSGFTLHPDFHDNGSLYVLFTEPDPDHPRADVLAEFTVTGPDLDVETERVLLRLEQPGTTHVGGRMAFGDDGLLYVGLGDAGRSELAQDPESLQGTIIRIDVDGDPYAVPDDNPFVDGGGAPEVYAYGFRNPFRGGWDSGHGMIVADPMWTSKDQEVHIAVPGGNFGYPVTTRGLDGSSCYSTETSTEPIPACLSGPDGEDFVPPVVEYAGQIAIGAVRYNGQAVPDLTGMLIVADWSGALIAATPDPDAARWLTTPLSVEADDDTGGTGRWPGSRYLWSLERGADGEVYALVIPRSFGDGRGTIYRLTAAG